MPDVESSKLSCAHLPIPDLWWVTCGNNPVAVRGPRQRVHLNTLTTEVPAIGEDIFARRYIPYMHYGIIAARSDVFAIWGPSRCPDPTATGMPCKKHSSWRSCRCVVSWRWMRSAR